MREFGIRILLNSSTLTPPNSTPPHHRHNHRQSHRPKPQLRPSKLSHSENPKLSNIHPPLSPLKWDSSSSQSPKSLNYYTSLASTLASNGRLDDFLLVLETLSGSGIDLSRFVSRLDTKLVSKGISIILEQGQVSCVVEFLKSAEKLGVSALNLLDSDAQNGIGQECRKLVERGKVKYAVDLLEILAGMNFSIKRLVQPLEILRRCVKNRDPETAMRFACTLPNAQILFCHIIQDFGKKRDLRSALVAFAMSKQKSDGPSMYAYRTIIEVCGFCRDYLKSRYIYEELLSQKVTPNVYVFNSLMNVNAHDLDYTVGIFKHMQHLGVMVDTTTFNIILKASCLAGRVDLAQEIYRDAQHLESKGALKLDVFTYSTIVKVFADAKLWQMALRIKDDMVVAGVTPNTVTWTSLISACANAGLVEKAMQLFEEMILVDCEPDSQCYNILLHACVEARQYDRAFRLFRRWKGSGFLTTHDSKENLDSTLKTGAKNCQPSSQCSSITKQTPFTPTTTTYNTLMKACGSDYYRALSLMDEIKTVGLSPNKITWSILIDICGCSGDVEGAIEILKFMMKEGIKPDVVCYTTVIKVCVESKSPKLAFSMFEEMKRNRIQPNLVTYNTLLKARSRYGSLDEVKQCLAVYQDMRHAGYKPNDYYLKQLIEEWCEGVIQNSSWKQNHLSAGDRTDLERTHSLLLEKIAVYLQKSNENFLDIDLQGLTKVEARIVVLAVLRSIKENYALGMGNPIKGDMLIILGIKKLEADRLNDEPDVKDAIIRLLRDELGLDIHLLEPRVPLRKHPDVDTAIASDSTRDDMLNLKLQPSRRPVVVQRLKVTNKALIQWLQRRERDSHVRPPTC